MKASVRRIGRDFEIGELGHESWDRADEICVETYWSGEKAPAGRHFSARLLWSDTSLYVRFEANQAEPLVTAEIPNLRSKTIGLWDRDVCEIFVAPNKEDASRYFEFEVAPNGEWIDLAVHQLTDRRETDWEFFSGMAVAGKIDSNRVRMALKIPWNAFAKTPKTGDVWRGNLFRCVGTDPGRGYLAWSPTLTIAPNFHIPEKFGELRFEN